MKVLVAGWFSFQQMGASAGDILTRDLVCQWLQGAGCPHDVALAPPFSGGVDWRQVNPADYTTVVFVCGPFGNGPPVVEFLDRFRGIQLIGMNLSMLESLEAWNPFDLLIERDSSARCRPDLAFLTDQELVPVVGVIRIDTQPEYGKRDVKNLADSLIDDLVADMEIAMIPVDTRLDENKFGLRSASEIEALIAKTDMVITTRLHGMVLALKNGVPALAIDPVSGGHKIQRQARAIGWPICFVADKCEPHELQEAARFCLTAKAGEQAKACRESARVQLSGVCGRFISAMDGTAN